MIYQKHIPQTYLGNPSSGSPHSHPDPSQRTQLEEANEIRVQNVFQLLSNEFQDDDNEFHYPLSAAIDHYETSIEKRVYTRESVTFGIIGLEALYGGQKGTVTPYCSLLLGLLDDQFDPLTVRERLQDGYGEHRNKWAHGARRKKRGKELQNAIWDYLRTSIVAFCLVNDEPPLTKGARNKIRSLLEKATIEEEVGEKLRNRTQNIDLSEYLS